MSSSPSTSELFTAIADASKLDVLARMQVMGVVEDVTFAVDNETRLFMFQSRIISSTRLQLTRPEAK